MPLEHDLLVPGNATANADVHWDEDADAALPDDGVSSHPDATASISTTAINIVSNVIGGGVLSMPMAMHQTSLGPGLMLLLLMAAISTYSMLLLVLCAERTRRFTYKDLLALALHEYAGRGFDVVLFFYTFGILVSYARIVMDSMPDVVATFFNTSGVWTEKWFWLLAAAAIFFPLSSLKQLSELKFTSILGFLSILYVIACVVVRFFMGTYKAPGQEGLVSPDVQYFHLSKSFLQAVPVCSVVFSCHYNIPPFYGELRDRTPQRMLSALRLAVPCIVTLYLVVGTFGLLMFGGHGVAEGKGDIINSFHEDDNPVNVGRLLMFAHFVCVYPIICIACRRALNIVVFNKVEHARWVYVLEAFCLVAASCVLAFIVKDISRIFSINGAAFGLSIVVVLPNVLYLRIFARDDTLAKPESEPVVVEYAELSPVGRSATDSSCDVASPHSDATAADAGVTSVHPQRHGLGWVEHADADAAPDTWDDRLRSLVERRHPMMRVLSIGLAVFGATMSVLSFTVTVVNIATGSD